ncbi:hypothetical protein GCM10010306_103360 [Streptomyces umbrinus]|nr:hypothetical protein GCM10010306_103360 [Streptomyces umbrinus]
MASLPEEFEAREAPAWHRVEELRIEAGELALRMEAAQQNLSRFEITRETVAKVLAELSAAGTRRSGCASGAYAGLSGA